MPVRRTRRSQFCLRVCVLALLLASGLAACNGPSEDAPAPAEPAPAAPAPPAETPQPPITPDASVPEPPAEPAAPAVPAINTAEPAAAPGEPAPPLAESPAPEPAPRSFRYDTYDRSGAVTEPGRYAFLADPGDPSSAVTTYEGLRDGTATALRIHTHDAHGVSQADLYGAVEAGDLVEWKQADDCFVRYQVTAVPEPPAAAVSRTFGVAWMTYAFTGCSGPIAADTAVTFEWGDLPNLGGTSLTAPIRHGSFQIVPEGWTGATEDPSGHSPPGWNINNPRYTENLAEARRYPYWREPALPSGWTFAQASTDPTRTTYGYRAVYSTPRGGLGFIVEGDHATYRGYTRDAAWRTNGGNHLSVTETRVIAGRPAQVTYSPLGPGHFDLAAVIVWIYDPATESRYAVYGETKSLLGANVDAVIAIACSLFEPPNSP